MAIKNGLILALAVLARSLFGGTDFGDMFYWTNGGGDGKWTTLANWTSDADGKVAATRYPGSDPEDADGIAFDIAKPAKGIRATEVEKVPSEDGSTVTFVAVFEPTGMVLLLK